LTFTDTDLLSEISVLLLPVQCCWNRWTHMRTKHAGHSSQPHLWN